MVLTVSEAIWTHNYSWLELRMTSSRRKPHSFRLHPLEGSSADALWLRLCSPAKKCAAAHVWGVKACRGRRDQENVLELLVWSVNMEVVENLVSVCSDFFLQGQ